MSLADLDFSKLEARMLELCSGINVDTLEKFPSTVDVHRLRAAEMFKVGYWDVTQDQRLVAKTSAFREMYK